MSESESPQSHLEFSEDELVQVAPPPVSKTRQSLQPQSLVITRDFEPDDPNLLERNLEWLRTTGCPSAAMAILRDSKLFHRFPQRLSLNSSSSPHTTLYFSTTSSFDAISQQILHSILPLVTAPHPFLALTFSHFASSSSSFFPWPSSSTSTSPGPKQQLQVSAGPLTSNEMDATQFVQHFLSTSRLSFLGNWKRRFERLVLEELPPPPPPPSSTSRVYFHVDLDCFFCAATLLKHPPETALLPVAVCGSDTASSDISSCNYKAREFGVKAGMSLHNAKERCPSLVVLSFDFPVYEELGVLFYKTLFEFSPYVEGVSCDEAYVDVSHFSSLESVDDVVQWGKRLQHQIFQRTRLHASVGCGPNKMLARLSTSLAKPNKVFSTLHMDEETLYATLLNENLTVSALHGIGRVTRKRLEDVFACTQCVDLRNIPLSRLQEEFGPQQGKKLFALARGTDPNPSWQPLPVRNSVSVQISWGVRMNTREQTTEFLNALCQELATRLGPPQALKPQVVVLSMKLWRAVPNAPEHMRKGSVGHGVCTLHSRSTRCATSRFQDVDVCAVLSGMSMELFDQLKIPFHLVRGVGISISGLSASTPSPTSIWETKPDDKSHEEKCRLYLKRGVERDVLEREITRAFEHGLPPSFNDNQDNGERLLFLYGERNRLAIRNRLVYLLQGLCTQVKNVQMARELISFVRFVVLTRYGVLPQFHVIHTLGARGGGVIYLFEILDDLDQVYANE